MSFKFGIPFFLLYTERFWLFFDYFFCIGFNEQPYVFCFDCFSDANKLFWYLLRLQCQSLRASPYSVKIWVALQSWLVPHVVFICVLLFRFDRFVWNKYWLQQIRAWNDLMYKLSGWRVPQWDWRRGQRYNDHHLFAKGKS